MNVTAKILPFVVVEHERAGIIAHCSHYGTIPMQDGLATREDILIAENGMHERGSTCDFEDDDCAQFDTSRA